MYHRYRSTAASTFVTPDVPSVEYDPLMEYSLSQNLERDVLVPLLQNLAGGFGVFVVIVAVQFWRIDFGGHSTTWAAVLLGAAYWAGGAFGVACAIRAFRDEIQVMAHHWARGWAEGRTNHELDWYREECERLQQENRELAVVNAQMVRKGAVTAEPARGAVQDEYTELLADAIKLCRFFSDHNTIARDKVMSAGMLTKARWEAACNLLQSAGVPINRGMLSMQAPMAIAAVREFVDKQRQAPAGFVMPDAD